LIFLRLNMSEKPQQAKVGKHRERIESPEAWRIQTFPLMESVGIVNKTTRSCIEFSRLRHLSSSVQRADFAGKGLNKNTAESISTNKGGIIQFQPFPPPPPPPPAPD
jgi:hypothetical protein